MMTNSPQHSRPPQTKIPYYYEKSRLNHLEAIEYNKDCCSINQRNESRRKSHVRGGGKEANHIKKIKIIKG
jgi:hypothetical protein